ncbi:MAG TPA: DNA recombination protein RmuC [Burkholderiales bacterium]|nr:DNA recombination protein RmuC [Burkholderiales bacterium]
MIEIALIILLVIIIIAQVLMHLRMQAQTRVLQTLSAQLDSGLEAKHRAMLVDLHSGLTQQGDRLGGQLTDTSERLRGSVSTELKQTRDTLHTLQLTLTQNLGAQREAMTEKLADTTRALNAKIDERLDQISGKVSERLDEGFKKTNETFVNVMARLATIDEAQKKIDGLTGSVLSLQELLGDKRARGAFGEVQLEALVRNVLPTSAFEMQCTLSNGTRADCVLKLPPPTGMVAVDSKFPLENYHRMFDPETNEVDYTLAQKQFKADIRRHVDAISSKYIIANETSDGAVMFIPAEAVFAEIHAHHAEVVEYANSKRVWIVSPTTLMAVLNTARAVLKDVETRNQIHVIKDELVKLSVDFSRFDDRMRKLADHVRQAHEDAQQVQISSKKISQRFAQIEGVELEETTAPLLKVVDRREDGSRGA